MSSGEWFWCSDHETAEPADRACGPEHRMGPYPSQEAAEHWKERVEARNESWDAADRAWSGDDETP